VRRALVSGGGGFVGGHLVRRLVDDGWWVRAVDRAPRIYGPSPAHEYLVLDLREPADASRALAGGFDEVYQLAADMGGMGFIESAECEIMRNNALINANVLHASFEAGVARYFLSSSACVYRDMAVGEGELTEDDAYPANPDNEYGWEKLYAERMALAYGRRWPTAVRIARFQNCYGPQGAWNDGREKAPAAICRKVAEAEPGGVIQAWGDGSAVRSFIYVDDLVDAVLTLMRSDRAEPTNIGHPQYVTVKELIDIVADVAGKPVSVEWIPGPVGVRSRNFSNAGIESLGWRPRHDLFAGIARTYPWIEDQVKAGARVGAS
jgi:GDP-D-mannose 3', 5'-epimerase